MGSLQLINAYFQDVRKGNNFVYIHMELVEF